MSPINLITKGEYEYQEIILRKYGVTAQEMFSVMEECGITVTRNPAEMGKTLKSVLK